MNLLELPSERGEVILLHRLGDGHGILRNPIGEDYVSDLRLLHGIYCLLTQD